MKLVPLFIIKPPPSAQSRWFLPSDAKKGVRLVVLVRVEPYSRDQSQQEREVGRLWQV